MNAVEPWDDARDLHVRRPAVPGHTMTTEPAGLNFTIRCECGWVSERTHLSNLIAAQNRHVIGALEHEHSREVSGRQIRVACSCGWRGKWRNRSSFLLERELHGDDGEHIHAVRRGKA